MEGFIVFLSNVVYQTINTDKRKVSHEAVFNIQFGFSLGFGILLVKRMCDERS
jgi:hypothetical protein